jgi:signal transduction histidine kinase/ActR/RegA family two-component response regulator
MTPTRPLRHHLLLLAAIGLLPVVMMGAWATHGLAENQREHLQRNALDLSRALASAVESELQATVYALQGLSRSPALDEGNIREFYELAQGAVQVRPNWAGMTLTDGDGRVLFRTRLPYGVASEKAVDRDSMEAALKGGKPVVGKLSSGPLGANLVPFRVPLVDDGGKAMYVVTAIVRPDRFLQILQRQNVPADWVISVFDASGMRIARTKDHAQTLGTPASPSLAALMRSSEREGSGVTTSLEGDENFAGFSKVPGYGWAVAVGVPTHAVNEAVQRTLLTYAAGVVASLLACWSLALLLARRVGGPINQVREQAILLGEGAPVGMRPTGIREVDEMAAALATAASQRAMAADEREKLLQSLQETLKLAEEAGRAKDGFMAMLGHELRNPLAPIVNSLQLMALKGDRATESERRIIGRQVEHMRRLVDDLLDISRITRGQLEIRDDPVDLHVVVERSIEAVRPLLTARDGPWRVDVPDQPLWVRGDEGRLVQVVVNLLTNALRFDAGGEISLTMQAFEERIDIVVRDHGAGMPPEVLAQVFEPFYQAPQSLARAVGGLGLGLAIVRSIVELHAGRVTADSAGAGQGSAFTVSLPRAAAIPADDAAQQSTTPAATSPSAARVLVVDDNVDAAETTAMLLQLAGFDVRSAHTGQDALQALAAFRPHVAVLDIGLPDVDGYELARRIHAAQADCALIALTGYGQASDREQSALAGFALHLAKPADGQVLIDAVHELAGRRPREEAALPQGH